MNPSQEAVDQAEGYHFSVAWSDELPSQASIRSQAYRSSMFKAAISFSMQNSRNVTAGRSSQYKAKILSKGGGVVPDKQRMSISSV